MPLSFAMALDIPVADVIDAVGHDGSKILFPNLPEPACRQGFHIQELIHVALNQRCSVTPIELFPVLGSADLRQTTTILYPTGNWNLFNSTIENSCGVIDGQGYRFGHMVAYDHGQIFDPKGFVYRYTRLAAEAYNFYTRCAWRIDRRV
jgi:hypothetical protein